MIDCSTRLEKRVTSVTKVTSNFLGSARASGVEHFSHCLSRLRSRTMFPFRMSPSSYSMPVQLKRTWSSCAGELVHWQLQGCEMLIHWHPIMINNGTCQSKSRARLLCVGFNDTVTFQERSRKGGGSLLDSKFGRGGAAKGIAGGGVCLERAFPLGNFFGACM